MCRGAVPMSTSDLEWFCKCALFWLALCARVRSHYVTPERPLWLTCNGPWWQFLARSLASVFKALMNKSRPTRLSCSASRRALQFVATYCLLAQAKAYPRELWRTGWRRIMVINNVEANMSDEWNLSLQKVPKHDDLAQSVFTEFTPGTWRTADTRKMLLQTTQTANCSWWPTFHE